MLNELYDKQQESDETVVAKDVSVTVETQSSTDDERVRREYTFNWAKEWNKWVFQEFVEQRTSTAVSVTDRTWRDTQHIMWSDVTDTPEIDVPPAVSDALAEATGADEVVMQVPSGYLSDK